MTGAIHPKSVLGPPWQRPTFGIDLVTQAFSLQALDPVGFAGVDADAIDFADLHRFHHPFELPVGFGLALDVAMRNYGDRCNNPQSPTSLRPLFGKPRLRHFA